MLISHDLKAHACTQQEGTHHPTHVWQQPLPDSCMHVDTGKDMRTVACLPPTLQHLHPL